MADIITASSLQDALNKALLLHLQTAPRALPELIQALSAAGFDAAVARESADALVRQGLIDVSVAGGSPPRIQLRLSEGAGVSAYELAEKSKGMPVFDSEPSLQAEGKIDPNEP